MVQTVVVGIEIAAKTAITSSLSLVFIGADPTLTWALMNLMQVLYYLLFLNVKYPQPMKKFLEIFKLGRLEFLPNFNSFIKEDIEADTTLYSPQNFQENDFSGLFLQSAGSMLFMITVSAFIYFIAKLIATINCFQSMKKIAQSIVTKFEWNIWLNVWLASYMELSFASLLQIYQLNFTTRVKIASSILAILVLILNLAFPMILHKILASKDKNKKRISKFSPIMQNVDINDSIKRKVFIFQTLKRLSQSLIIVIIYEANVFQNALNCLPGLLYLIFLVVKKPFNRTIINLSEIIIEICFLGIHSLVFILALDDSTLKMAKNSRFQIGFVLISFCSILILIQIIIMIKEQYDTIKSFLKSVRIYLKKSNWKKEQKNNIIKFKPKPIVTMRQTIKQKEQFVRTHNKQQIKKRIKIRRSRQLVNQEGEIKDNM